VPVTPLANVSARHVEMIGLFQIVLPSLRACGQSIPRPAQLGDLVGSRIVCTAQTEIWMQPPPEL
jgi:hypothetical protein